MKGAFAIARREILSFFVSPIAYFIIAGFTLLCAYFFFNLLAFFNIYLRQAASMPFAGMEAPNLNQMVVENFFQTLVVILLFLTPLLTMRTIAEEKKRGTFELLVTSPISVFEIVIGKFLGVSCLVLLMMLAAFMFPALLIWYGNPGPEVLPILSGILGLTLCTLAFASLGMAVSCFTENQIVAAVSGMVLLLLLYVIQAPAESVGGTTANILNYLSPSMQLRDLLRGVISLKSCVYFGSVIVLGLFLSQRALDAYRWR